MLRIAVIVLLLANAGYYAWSQGMLRDMGYGPTVQSEPQRLNQQIDPQKMQVTPVSVAAQASASAASATVAAASAASAPASTPSAPASAASVAVAAAPTPVPAASAPAPATPPQRTVCLQAGSYDEQQMQTLRIAAQSALPANSWRFDPTPVPGRWMVYIGKLPDDDAVAKKRSELKNLQIDYDRPGAAFEPGLSLGRFSTDEAAQRALSQLTSKGVRTAKVVVERKETNVYTLRLPTADDALRAKAEGQLRTALLGKPLKHCGT
ncbi:SPOR domain-containing protein [Diaphorobacter sp. HDW4B]|uniref:SPOR domain-containing protein n=1 Tax=Diaphorobacter sp. HDW4B TaxID=2714925 RepID=UPI001409BFF5|nr:SPOR domain-containing protein [Diaphorobacter sp. HDW4B]QIL71228.1 SPOR domain-containing protein [Diaphorobacter sp. HDW4B]